MANLTPGPCRLARRALGAFQGLVLDPALLILGLAADIARLPADLRIGAVFPGVTEQSVRELVAADAEADEDGNGDLPAAWTPRPVLEVVRDAARAGNPVAGTRED